MHIESIAVVRSECMKSLCILIILLLIKSNALHSQTGNYVVTAQRLDAQSTINIDGILDEPYWENVTPATGFTEFEPDFGRMARQNTQARFLYDDYGLYIGLEMLDEFPDSVFRDLSVRDDMGNSDWVGVIISPFNDGQNGFRFQVSAAGVQYDAKIIRDNNDPSWDAVWYSKTTINTEGWVVEMLIPWSAIRFPNLNIHNWDINIIREVRRYREQSTWRPVDKKKHGFLTQSGRLNGLTDLKTPVRLALMPYASGYLQKMSNQDHSSYTFNAGMDVKYGILNNYTLDITLIPDFGQVRSDDEIYNFSPHEVKYNENRPFFTEGTELFDKAGIFYSRRIGQRPRGFYSVYDDLKEGEMVDYNPAETQLINATKFSGRNNNGFAVGIFNAMTRTARAEISDSTGSTRYFETQPFTNYNMLVLDQSLRNNSYIHLANTNLSNRNYIANVTASTFQLINRNQSLALSGEGRLSNRTVEGMQQDPGFQYGLSISKISGNLRLSARHATTSKLYNPNDMGYLTMNNKSEVYGEIGYYQFRPYRNMLNFHTVLSSTYNMLYEDLRFTHFQLNLRGVATYRNRLSVGGNLGVVPGEFHDYYDARVEGRAFIQSGYSNFGFWLSPDYRKKFLVDLNIDGWGFHDKGQQGFSVRLSPRLRINTRSILIASSQLDMEIPAIGFVDHIYPFDTLIIIFGEREVQKLTNTLSYSYIVSPLSSFSLRIRHYWVVTEYSGFFELDEEGYINSYDLNENRDFTVNIFNIDLGYSWNFAPGSYFQVMYKNSVNSRELEKVQKSFTRNWEDVLDAPANNSITLKLIYYIDYESIKRNIRRKSL